MRVVTGLEMQQIDQRAINELGLPSMVLMENAGVATLRLLLQEYASLQVKRVNVLVGCGNNGGDGLVVARYLINRGIRTKVYIVGKEGKFSEESGRNLDIFRKLGGDVNFVDEKSLPKLRFSLGMADLIVDALIGVGCHGALRGLVAKVVELVNELDTPVLAIDVPTGVDSDTGEVKGEAIRADMTVTFSFPKLGLLLYPGREHVGKLFVADIGLPKSLGDGLNRLLVTKESAPKLAARPPWGHKGTFGHALVIAGSQTMAGAAALCSQAVLRSGAGMVTLAVPASIAHRFSANEVIVVPVSDGGDGLFGKKSTEGLLRLLDRKDVLAIGPGLSTNSEMALLVATILKHWTGPVVIDADGLNNLDLDFVKTSNLAMENWVMTPHPGEFARLSGKPLKDEAERVKAAWEFAKQTGVTLVLKGAPTVTASQGQVYINHSGNHALATAGTGDVLTGIIAGLIAQGMSLSDAAQLGVFLHGQASDILIKEKGRGMVAGDLLPCLPSLFQTDRGCENVSQGYYDFRCL